MKQMDGLSNELNGMYDGVSEKKKYVMSEFERIFTKLEAAATLQCYECLASVLNILFFHAGWCFIRATKSFATLTSK